MCVCVCVKTGFPSGFILRSLLAFYEAPHTQIFGGRFLIKFESENKNID